MELNWIFDVAAGLLLIGFVVQGVRKGFSKLIVHSAVNIFFVLLSFFVSGIVAGTFFDSFVEDAVESSVNEVVEKFDVSENLSRRYTELTLIEDVSDREISKVLEKEEDMDKYFWKLINATSGVGGIVSEEQCCDALNSIITVSLQEKISEKLPSCAGKYFENTDREQTFRILNMMHTDKRNAAEYIVKNYIGDNMFHFVKLVSFVLTAVVLMIISNIIFSVAFRDKDMTTNGISDSVFGALLEIVNAVLVLVVFAVLIKITVYSGVEIKGIMDDEILNDSYIFRFLYNADKFMPGVR